MIPSETARISSKAFTAAGFSIFDRIAARPLASSRASSTSCGALHEGQRQPVDAQLADELEIVAVLVGQRRQRQHHVGHVHALAVRDRAARPSTVQFGEIRAAVVDPQPDLAVVDQQATSRARARRRSRDAAAAPARASPGASSRSKRKVWPSSRSSASSSRRRPAQLRPLQVGEDGDRAADVRLDLADDRVRGAAISSWVPWVMFRRNTSAPASNRRGSCRSRSTPGQAWRRSSRCGCVSWVSFFRSVSAHRGQAVYGLFPPE